MAVVSSCFRSLSVGMRAGSHQSADGISRFIISGLHATSAYAAASRTSLTPGTACLRRRLVRSRVVHAAAGGNDQHKAAPLVKVTFTVPNCHVAFGTHLAVVGSSRELGRWTTEEGVPLAWGEGDSWSCSTALPAGSRHEFKLIKVAPDCVQSHSVQWEGSDCNRVLHVPADAAGTASIDVVCAAFGDTARTAVELRPRPSPAAPRASAAVAALAVATEAGNNSAAAHMPWAGSEIAKAPAAAVAQQQEQGQQQQQQQQPVPEPEPELALAGAAAGAAEAAECSPCSGRCLTPDVMARVYSATLLTPVSEDEVSDDEKAWWELQQRRAAGERAAAARCTEPAAAAGTAAGAAVARAAGTEHGAAEVANADPPSSAGLATTSRAAAPPTAELQALDCSASLSASGGGAEAAPAALAGSAAAAALAAAHAEQTRDAGVLFHFTEPAAAATSAAELAEQQLGSVLPPRQQQQLQRILRGRPKPAATAKPAGESARHRSTGCTSGNDASGSTSKRINPSALRGGGPLGASRDEGHKPSIPDTPAPAVPSPATVPEVSLSGSAGGTPAAPASPVPAPAVAEPAGPTPALPAASAPAPPAVGTSPSAAPGSRQPAATSDNTLSSAALPGLVLVLAGQAGLSVMKALWGAGRAALRRS